MAIAPVIAQTRSLYKEQQADIERFEVAIAQYLAGEIEEDVFRVIRLNNGVYGQRQGGTNQMVRRTTMAMKPTTKAGTSGALRPGKRGVMPADGR